MRAQPAIDLAAGMCAPNGVVFEAGPGNGEHSTYLRGKGLRVVTIGPHRGCSVYGVWPVHAPEEARCDMFLASHVLEHTGVPTLFLSRAFDCLRDRAGVLCIIVPPMKPQLVGGHLTLWTTGHLVYNAVMAGIDCREAYIWKDGYNVCLVVKCEREVPLDSLPLRFDNGDLEVLAPYFPVPVEQDMDGWKVERRAE